MKKDSQMAGNNVSTIVRAVNPGIAGNIVALLSRMRAFHDDSLAGLLIPVA